jgi:hypothetical protein
MMRSQSEPNEEDKNDEENRGIIKDRSKHAIR